ncbi:MAG: lipopolysaccharide heptosyltransferase II [Candidatus Hydrogenedentes bacterium]|nr:lipopolysaccharide heptosyltransferase II [Candidatus Hydrogenedentota bacterium]
MIPNWIGDAAMCTPALRALHQGFPGGEITVAGRAAPCALLHGLPCVARQFVLPSRPGWLEMRELGHQLKPHARDLAVVLPHSFRSAVLAAFTRANQRLGYNRDGRSFLLTDAVPPHRVNGRIEPIYMAKEYLDLVATIGCKDDGHGLELATDPAVSAQVRTSLSGNGPLIGIAPGAAFGPSKLWPSGRYAQVADMLAKQLGARCVLLTGPGEEQTRDAVRAAAKTPLLCADDGAPTLETLKAAVSQLDLLICNDSGTRHVAVAFGVPTVCIMGPTSPRYSEGPYERGKVLRVDVDCGPCQKPVCATDHRCMTRISADWVAETASKILRQET